MGESATPFGETDKRQSINRSILKLPTGSSSHCSVHILPLLGLSKIQIIRWWSNKKVAQNLSIQTGADCYLLSSKAHG